MGEALRWKPGLLPSSGFNSTDGISLGGDGEEQPNPIFRVVEESEVLLREGVVDGSIPLRVIGGESANFDVVSVVGRAQALVSSLASGDACSGNKYLNGRGEEGGVLKQSASAKVIWVPGEGGELIGE